MVNPESIPDHDQLIEILSAEGAPPRIILDLGNSEDESGRLADLDGDNLVMVSLEDGQLVFKDDGEEGD